MVELPPKTIELHRLEFNAEEREGYMMIETRSQQVFNRYFKEGTVLKYVPPSALTLIIELTQCAAVLGTTPTVRTLLLENNMPTDPASDIPVLTMILRLRQLCTHPCLITLQGFPFIHPGEEADPSDRNAKLLSAAKLVGSARINNLRRKYMQITLDRMAAERDVCTQCCESR